MTNFELWIKGCEQNKTLLYCLEGSGDTALYKSQNEYWVKNNKYFTEPVYHVWKNGKGTYCGLNMHEAFSSWRYGN